MSEWVKAVCIVILYFFLFWSFGSGFACLFSKKKRAAGEVIVTGFFLYHALFQVVTIPMMFARRSLSELAAVWGVVTALICAASVLAKRKEAKKGQNVHEESTDDKAEGIRRKKGAWELFWRLLPWGVAFVNVAVVSVIYSNYWDATYYVGNVSFSLYTNSIYTMNPLSGRLLDSFDIKHCLATYHMNDAVMCRLFQIHPMIETKTIMVVVITILLNLVYGQYAKFFFKENFRARGLFMGFAFLINLCSYTAYTSSSFVLLRTYEGKAITGAIVAILLLYWFLQLWEGAETYGWRALFVTAWGAVAISSSALFLVISGIGVFAVLKVWQSKRFREALWCGICMLPAMLMLFCYLVNRLGYLAIPITR